MELARRRIKAPADGRPLHLYPVGYWAGLFDGEGCVQIVTTNGKGHCPKVSVVNTHLGILRTLRDTYGGSLLPHQKLQKAHHLPSWTWAASANIAIQFLQDIQPYSVIKRDQIDLALEFSTRRRKTSNRPVTAGELAMRSDYIIQLREMKHGAG